MTLSSKLDAFLSRHFPLELVPETGPAFLRRFKLRSGRDSWQLYVHHFVRAGHDEGSHDHPWHFISIMLRGQYDEILYDHGMPVSWRTVKAPALVVRNRNTIHKLDCIRADTWTVVITSKWLGRWGYWDDTSEWTYHKIEQAFRRLARDLKVAGGANDPKLRSEAAEPEPALARQP